MGLDAFSEKIPEVSEETTVSELIDIYGEEAVFRAIKYMHSLSDADENYRNAISSEDMEEGYHDAGVQEGDAVEKSSDKWERESSESGLGIED